MNQLFKTNNNFKQMNELEQQLAQENSTIKHFNLILPIAIPKKSKYYELIRRRTYTNTYKSLATLKILGGSKVLKKVGKNEVEVEYIEEVMDKFGIWEIVKEVEATFKRKANYDLTAAVKRGTNVIAFFISKEEGVREIFMECMPMNDPTGIQLASTLIANEGHKTIIEAFENDLKDLRK